ncbi:Tetratricopeptide repeat-containing protein [Parageobacillus thermantarcticus]|uniref:Tetratricopeptide repeat-containing protein n=1 Tax=Parageobacillus thermantarcticus TaxID=186116 RepID=A0A1I0TJC2_9BACL|nr:dynamin family protein [Parageobacillus thermantarcticus]SFA51892.1 Tetratricopeptide repeat-containing protein [Parageobacillus thermantarcticus]
MTLENQLIKKTFYETLMEADENNPVRVLGEAFFAGHKDEEADISTIRFAQGEVYFHNKDYEAAIFKWENVHNHLAPWAKKNIADCYYELGQLSTAEEIYKSIDTDNSVLQSEVALQLFSLYIDQSRLEEADQVIKKAVSFNPDYPNVTDIARSFFEKHKDWKSAIELAVNEAVRTESPHWFDILKTYADKGLTKIFEPHYFSKCLVVLYGVDQARFEQMVQALWNGYKNERSYFSWLREFNRLFFNLDANRDRPWTELPALYEETYFELIDGKYLIKELEEIIPDILTNWLKIADDSYALFASAAILAWSEKFPSSISPEVVNDAENLIFRSRNETDGLEYSLTLFDSIVKWAEAQHVDPCHRFRWIIRELVDFQTHHLLVAGASGNGKSAFINSVLGENILTAPTSSVIVFKGDEETEIRKISDEALTTLSFHEFQEAVDRRMNKDCDDAIVEFSLPSPILQENRLVLIDTPGFSDCNEGEALKYLHLADSLLFVLNANDPFTEKEQEILMRIRKHAPNLPIHFLLHKIDEIYDEHEAASVIEDTRSRVRAYFPQAKVLVYSSRLRSRKQQNELAEFLKNLNRQIAEDDRIEKILIFIRKLIKYLLDKREEIENNLTDSIKWNEEMAAKLSGAIHQLTDLKEEKTRMITRMFHKILEEIRADLSENIPKILRGTSDMIQEDSDFRKIHLELNDEMNRRVYAYVNDRVLSKLYRSLQEWILTANDELNHCQLFLDEISDGFNALYGEERLKLNCDFKVLDDWRRDADRMTSGVQMEKVNIFLRRTPYQILLKSAGRLFGAFQQNNALLYNKYKQFVESQDYLDVTESIVNKLLLQFELFEKSLERDISIFFRNPFAVLNQTVEETKKEINKKEEELEKMRANPEAYRDPLTLFEVKLRQYEWIAVSAKGVFQV